jgi:predicted aspartyl protease
MIPIFINQIPVRALIDTGADISLISGRIYNKISKNIKAGDRNKNTKTVLTANAKPLTITAETEVELKINGLRIPFTVSVIEELN